VLLIALAALPVLIWIYLLFGRGSFWHVGGAGSNIAGRASACAGLQRRRIVAVIPARNEAEVIGEAITSLLQQDLPDPLEIILIDDASTDGTSGSARFAAERCGATDRLTVIQGKPLVPRWTGKLWALSQGVAAATERGPDYLLLTDADIRHGKHSLADLLQIAASGNYDLASLMVKLHCETAAERALIPAFVFFFLMLYPPAWISSPKKRTAGAAGGCILIRSEALQRIGGLASIRNQIIDDCALARAVKRSGGRIWMGLSGDTESIRGYGSFGEIGRMISRTAFNQLRHSPAILAGTITGLFLTYLLPFVLLFSGKLTALALGATAWMLMAIAYLPMVHFYRRGFWWSFALPAVALFYMCATVHSAVQYWRGKGGEWKGRVQDVRTSQ
jgi:hopene-associated glycosyltransferase HpnB